MICFDSEYVLHFIIMSMSLQILSMIFPDSEYVLHIMSIDFQFLSMFFSDSEYDVANEVGAIGNTSTSSPSTDSPCNAEETLSSEVRHKLWDLNYQEAAIYLQEGRCYEQKPSENEI